MIHPTVDIHMYLKPGVRVHLAGIGGVSMCPLAEVLRGMGLTVQGSDMSESDTVRHLRSLGIDVAIGHSAENLKDCDLVIRTSGEQRTSNFLPWEAAYAELDFVPELFPDCGREVLWRSIDHYIHRDRRFGGVKR